MADFRPQPGYRGLLAFTEAIEEPLQPYMKRIARAYFGPAREIAAILPKGNYKTHLAALIGLHNLLTRRSTPSSAGSPAGRWITCSVPGIRPARSSG